MFTYFYHQRIRKSVAIFGTLFNNIYVLRKNSSGDVISQVKVPLSYAPKEKYLERIRENPDLDTDTKVALKLPRMSFEITSLTYDAERTLPRTNNFRQTLAGSNTNAIKTFTPAPYLISFQLNVYAKTQDDALQVVEQVLPYFNPEYTLTMKPFGDYDNFLEDVAIGIQGVTFTDDFEGTVEQRRTIIYSLEFEMRTNFYGPLNNQSVIRTAIANTGLLLDSGDTGSLGDSDAKFGTITVTPDPTNVSLDSDFGFSINVENDIT